MEQFQAQGYSSEKLQILNRCRLYLQVLTLSDIMNGNGDGFTSSFNCQRDHQKRNKYTWPYQPKPSTSMIKFWRKALRKTFQLRAGKVQHKVGK